MITVIRMCMIMHPAGPVVIYMRRNDQEHGRYEQPKLVLVKDLL